MSATPLIHPDTQVIPPVYHHDSSMIPSAYPVDTRMIPVCLLWKICKQIPWAWASASFPSAFDTPSARTCLDWSVIRMRSRPHRSMSWLGCFIRMDSWSSNKESSYCASWLSKPRLTATLKRLNSASAWELLLVSVRRWIKRRLRCVERAEEACSLGLVWSK